MNSTPISEQPAGVAAPPSAPSGPMSRALDGPQLRSLPVQEAAEQAQKIAGLAPVLWGYMRPREREIVYLLGCGMRNREMARALRLSEGTVKVYLARLRERIPLDRGRLALVGQEMRRRDALPPLRQAN